MAFSLDETKDSPNRYGNTEVRGGRVNHLSISWDSDHEKGEEINPYPVLLFTPDMLDTTEHYHIELDLVQSEILHEWLGDFIKTKRMMLGVSGRRS